MVVSSVYLQDNLMSQIGIEIIWDPKSTTPGGVAKSQNARIARKIWNHQNKALDR